MGDVDVKKRLYMVGVNGRYGENVYPPFAVGCLWAYARTFPKITDAYEMCGFLYLKEPITTAIARLEEPDLIGLSCYIWNWEWSKAFAQAVKAKWPSCKIIVGGVQIQDESPKTLEEHPYFDFAIYGEGEGAFADFLKAHTLADNSAGTSYIGVGSLIYHTYNGIVVNPRRAFTDLAELRSPYLDGVFDELWPREPRWQVLQETARGCPYASFSGDTLVCLPDRILYFNDEKYDDQRTLSCPDHRHQHRIGINDKRIISQGVRDCLKLTFSNGLALTVTPNHPMMVVRNEKIVDVKAEELILGDWIPVEVGQNSITENVRLAAPSKTKAEIHSVKGLGQGRRVPNTVVLPTHLDERVAWLAGYLIGDGCLPSDDRADVHFCVTDKSRLMLTTLISDLFNLRLRIHDSKFTNKMQNGVVHSRKVVQFFKESLNIEPCENKLKVPRAIFKSPIPVVRSFLDGLWCADGYWPSGSEPYLTTISNQLAKECAALIHWIGDAAVVRKLPQRSSFIGAKPFFYRVEWHVKECRTRTKGKPCIASRVPAIRHTYRNRIGKLMLRHTTRRSRYGCPREVLRYFEPNHVLLDKRFVFVQVTSSHPAGKHATYDVHHHPSHKVAANGAYVRQCSFCAWGQAALSELRQFPIDRVRDEIEWFGQHKVDYIDNADANFGIVKRDIELTKHLVAVKAKYGYPKTFRTSFAKNSNETIWEIANLLHDAQMLKSVTLAMQSMDDGVLINIQRKNIKFSKFGELIQRYEAAGIPTYTELILGLPGETYEMFLDGIEKNLDAGQHSGLFIYLNIMLNNTEQNTPAYIAKYGLETHVMQAMLTHGTPDDSVVREKQEIITGTSAMPHTDWKKAYLFAKVIEIFHAQGLLQEVAIALHKRGMRYRDFYSHLQDWLILHPTTVAGREYYRIVKLLDGVLAGRSWDLVDPKFGDISWPPEEFAFANICCEAVAFHNEIWPFLKECGVTEDEAALQSYTTLAPPPGDEKRWVREIVWFGRKGSASKMRTARAGGE